MNFAEVAPDAYRLLIQLDAYASRHVDRTLLELVKLRASVLNGCAFCVDMHSADALKAGENAQRLFAVSVWRESRFFTDTERLALELTDAVTRLGEHGVPDELWRRASATWSEKELADLVALIISINALNRLGVTLDMGTERALAKDL
ncbi:carboxymuconolactone decarboxylase family protein [Saccharothrix coeruleofusca]|uniref:carboxymuconolactone decarboxylase family protein n=1 Tax=Saccharothrix coeruleofusca TaxID=33919 RepID=UPI00166FA8D9|nr:carboxymuconolactone decarboxylase family protein [Saccharothrix coeruleofusca]